MTHHPSSFNLGSRLESLTRGSEHRQSLFGTFLSANYIVLYGHIGH